MLKSRSLKEAGIQMRKNPFIKIILFKGLVLNALVNSSVHDIQPVARSHHGKSECIFSNSIL